MDILEVLKLYVPCKWVQGPPGRARREGPHSEAQLGKVRGTLSGWQVTPVWSLSFPLTPTQGPRGLEP